MPNRMHLRAALLTLAIASPPGASGASFGDMYVIGDSLSDQGNVFAATQDLTTFGIPADDNYYMGRFADGEVYAGVLAEKLGVMLLPSLNADGIDNLAGNNFADGGARTDYNIVEDDATKPFPVDLLGHGGTLPEDAFPWTLNGQTQAFHERVVVDPDALYLVFAGANDLSDLTTMVALAAAGFPQVDPKEFIGKVVTGINNAIAEFVDAGAQHILVPNVPNLGVVPAVTVNGAAFSHLATLLSAQYNLALNNVLEQWEGAGVVNIIPFDTFSFLTAVVYDPDAFGFENASEACYTGFVEPAGPDDTVCANPDSYVFWDKEHPTAAAHALLADRMRAAIVLDILDDLARQVDDLDVRDGIKVSLNKELDGAIRAFTDDNVKNDRSAAKKLQAFINFVEAQQGKKIPDRAARSLIDGAEKILPLINAG